LPDSNCLELDRRGIKGKIRRMPGSKSYDAASRFCREHGELSDFLRSRRHHNQLVSPLPSAAVVSSKPPQIAVNIMRAA
jgi:hypothetical protein